VVLEELAVITVVVQILLLLPLHRCRDRLVVVEEEEEEEEEEGGGLLLVRLRLLPVKGEGRTALQALLGRRGWEGKQRRSCIKVCEGGGRREGGRGGRRMTEGDVVVEGREGEISSTLLSSLNAPLVPN